MVVRRALARVVGHGEHSLTPDDSVNGNRGRMKTHREGLAHARRPFDGLTRVGGNTAHGSETFRKALKDITGRTISVTVTEFGSFGCQRRKSRPIARMINTNPTTSQTKTHSIGFNPSTCINSFRLQGLVLPAATSRKSDSGAECPSAPLPQAAISDTPAHPAVPDRRSASLYMPAWLPQACVHTESIHLH